MAAASCCFVASWDLMSSIAAGALRDLSRSRAAAAARSRPSGSKPVRDDFLPEEAGAFSGAIIWLSDDSSFFFLFPPNMLIVLCLVYGMYVV